MKMHSILSGIFAFALIFDSIPVHVSAESSFGDANADGIINAVDAAEILQQAADYGAGISSGSQHLAVMDINQDNTISAVDASLVLKYSAKAGAGTMNLDFSDFIKTITSPELTLNGVQYSRFERLVCGNGVSSGGSDDFRYVLITSETELESYVSSVMMINNYEPYTRHDGLSLTDAAKKYDSSFCDSSFFETQDLVVVEVREAGGEFEDEVKTITMNEDYQCTINIDRLIPLTSDCRISPRAIFIETSKAIETAESIDIIFTEILPSY